MTARARPLLAALCALLLGALATSAAAQENDRSPSIAAPPAGGSAEPKTDLADIEDEVMCPICGTALGLSESPQANRQREFIRELIGEGRTKDQIKDALVAEYGEEVLAVPQGEGFDLAAWLVPGLAIVIAAIGIFVGLRRWRTPRGPDSAPKRPREADEERLARDLARYDL